MAPFPNIEYILYDHLEDFQPIPLLILAKNSPQSL